MTALFASAASTLASMVVTGASIAHNVTVPVVIEVGRTASRIGQEHVVPAICEAGMTALKVGQEKVVPALADVAQKTGPAIAAAGSWVAEHPGETAWYASSGLTIAFPGLLAGPLLWAAGWGATGVRGASLAAGYQATAGSIVAGGKFATLTSCGMGGYGVAAVHGATRIGAAIVGVLGRGVGAGLSAVAASNSTMKN